MPPVLDLATAVAFSVAAATWVGGLVAAAVVVRTARASLAPPDQVEFFRALGRRYLAVLGTAFVVVATTGAWLLRTHPWDAAMTALALTVGALASATVAGVVQARAMTRLRRGAVDSPDDPGLRDAVVDGARRAVVLRSAIAVLTLAAVVVGVAVATD
ncbi:hypothetical protein [Cellulomonas fimi]|uniref:Copper resistance protein D domain-containing protein n=1 Tax=Cellulomonas fimi TaxID=1708 RepID=A0A7Y0QG83_CELFI|nr:hypothetical protein [Cellulomonas fimi]NMR18960.1 hypothetical protein [Cellulomonas fimi]